MWIPATKVVFKIFYSSVVLEKELRDTNYHNSNSKAKSKINLLYVLVLGGLVK